ncbi:DUF2625 domain-containing protein [Deminuibacter soli]|uniref:DUF2625 domain-containing protein n=2 Tax=Deminuibacter soli TaxID=2291815 RepID=A0A3E1NE99_9BACT|nr:DUF2625 domain-containing protein [Deminuibacter soli]
MRPVTDLINITDPAWPLVKQWIDAATNKVEILQADAAKGRDALYKTQVTTRSPMGAIIYATGGLLIDNGWIRILGSGSTKLNRSLPDWNVGKSIKAIGDRPAFLLIADDAAGGFFAINGGALGKDAGNVYYLSPDTLTWDSLDMGYSDFLQFCFKGDLGAFYKTLRWKSWKTEVAALDGNQAYSFYPFLWSKEGKDINKDSRKAVPVDELYTSIYSARIQLGISQ